MPESQSSPGCVVAALICWVLSLSALIDGWYGAAAGAFILGMVICLVAGSEGGGNE